MPLPLSGLRVIDLGVVLAGPQAALMLGDLGAEVIRVESTQAFAPLTRGLVARPSREMVRTLPPIMGGYPGRDPGQRPWNRFPWFNTLARNKLSMTVDLRRPRGMEIMHRLLRISDCLLVNQRAGTMDEIGLGYEAAAAVNPRIVYVDASGFGATGPWSRYRAFGSQVEAVVGHDVLRHEPKGDIHSNSWTVAADAASGMCMAAAALMALWRREETGQGEYVDLSMAEVFLTNLGSIVLDQAINGRCLGSLGNRDYTAIQGCYPCAGEDRWIVLTVCDDAAWAGLVRTIGRPEWEHDPAFATAELRRANYDRIDEAITAWTRGLSRAEAVERLRRNGVIAGPVLDDADAFHDPHLRARGFFLDIEQADAGRHDYPGPPYRLRGTPFRVRQPPVRLGEHNEYVYRELLGYSADDYQQFIELGHVGTEYAPDIA